MWVSSIHRSLTWWCALVNPVTGVQRQVDLLSAQASQTRHSGKLEVQRPRLIKVRWRATEDSTGGVKQTPPPSTWVSIDRHTCTRTYTHCSLEVVMRLLNNGKKLSHYPEFTPFLGFQMPLQIAPLITNCVNNVLVWHAWQTLGDGDQISCVCLSLTSLRWLPNRSFLLKKRFNSKL